MHILSVKKNFCVMFIAKIRFIRYIYIYMYIYITIYYIYIHIYIYIYVYMYINQLLVLTIADMSP